MEPTANFTGAIDRFELTNTDIGAAQDIGWQVIPEPSSLLLLSFTALFGFCRRR